MNDEAHHPYLSPDDDEVFLTEEAAEAVAAQLRVCEPDEVYSVHCYMRVSPRLSKHPGGQLGQ